MKRRYTGPSEDVKRAVLEREKYRCRRCRGMVTDIHHRKPRGMGGTKDPAINDPVNLVALCRACHDWVERNRGIAYHQGWLVHSWDDPASVPIRPHEWPDTN